MLLLFTLIPLALIGFVASEINDDDDNATDQADIVQGSDEPETFETGAGDDEVFAGGGNDLIDAGSGDDMVFGQDGSDVIFAGEGDDFVRGSDGSDDLNGDAGEDTLFGDAGDDTIFGADLFDNGALFDIIAETGFFPSDTSPFFDVNGDPGEADTLNGGQGDDDLIPGDNDVVSTGNGDDSLLLGDWIAGDDPDAAPVITDFNPTQDSILYFHEGDAPSDVAFGEEDDGGNLIIDGEVVARFINTEFAALNGEVITFVQLPGTL